MSMPYELVGPPLPRSEHRSQGDAAEAGHDRSRHDRRRSAVLPRLVRRFTQLGRADGFVSYRAEVVPTVWVSSRCHRLSHLSTEVGPRHRQESARRDGITDYRMSVTGTHAARDYCVQYRESNLDFISRSAGKKEFLLLRTHEGQAHDGLRRCPGDDQSRSGRQLSMNLVSAGTERRTSSRRWTSGARCAAGR